MQGNLKLVIWTLAALIAAWFIAMAINRNFFSHSDVDRTVIGVISLNRTDVGDQCGEEYVNSSDLIEYKMNEAGQIVYLCPQGIWPIQKTVVAAVVTNDFRMRINPLLRDKLNRVYPIADAQPVMSSQAAVPAMGQAAPQPAPVQQTPANNPAAVMPQGLFSPPASNTPKPQTTAPAAPKPAPAEPVNPFIGNAPAGTNSPAAPSPPAAPASQ